MKKCQLVVREGPVTIKKVRYKQCNKNQAAKSGGHAWNGCQEFLASGEEGTSAALTCAACGCHRNFHKKEEEIEVVLESGPPPNNAS